MKKLLLRILLVTFVVSVISCKKTNEPKPSDAEVNYNGSIADPSATFTPFQIPAGGITGLQASYDLTDFMPPVRNQNPQGSCVAFCLSYLKSYHERLEYGYTYSGNDKIMSPAFIFNQFKQFGDCSTGINTISALNFLKQNGISTEAEFPYNSSDCSNQPNQTIKTNAVKNKIREWEGFVFQNNNDVIDEMKFAISQMQPVIIDFRVDAEFAAFNLFSWGTIIWKQNNSGDPTINGVRTPGYHCALLVGYDDDKNAFKLLNSWGTWWKNDGYCWVDYAWLLQRVRYAFVTYDEFHTAGNGDLEITGDLNFGNTAINTSSTKTIQLVNNGTTDINVSSISITSPFSTNWNNGTIQAGGSQAVTITFNPTSVGNASKTLTINSNAGNSPTTIQANGTGVQQTTQTKIISLSGNLSYGSVIVGQSLSNTLTISNTGNSPLVVSSISTPQGFSGSYSGTIQAGNSANVTITFSPTNVQSYSGNITVNSDATSGTNIINVSGDGTQQATQTRIISLSGNLSYGNVTVGQSSSKTLTIANNGNSPLFVSSISTPQSFSGSYSGTIQAGSSVNVTITFSPSNIQSYSDVITVNSDATSGTNTRNCSGNGVSSGPVVVPAIGTYATCASVGSYNCPPSFGLGIIRGRIVSINTSTHQIVVEIKKCDGTSFNAGGNMNVVNLLCGGAGAVSYGFGSFSAGANTVQLTITDNDMTGSKAYVPFIVQGASLDIYYSAPTIVVTY